MMKPLSAADEPGYIYCFEISNPTNPNELQLKVGQAVSGVGRLDQWADQFCSKDPIPLGCWPHQIPNDDNTLPNLLNGGIRPGQKGKLSHRLERMFHSVNWLPTNLHDD